MANAISLTDELSQAFDASEAKAPTEDKTEAPAASDAAVLEADVPQTSAAEAPADAEARTRDAQGRFVARTVLEADKPVAAEVVAVPPESGQAAQPETAGTPAAPAAPDAPPSTWTPAAKAVYKDLPPVVRAEVKKRELDIQRGLQQYKEAADYGRAMHDAIQPYIPMLQAEGAQPAQAITNLLNTAYRLRTGSPYERGQMVMGIAQQFGADLTPWMQAAQQGGEATNQPTAAQFAAYIDQKVAQQLAPFTQQQQQQALAAEVARQQTEQATAHYIQQFRSAVNEKGQPEHVYFDNVSGLMSAILANGDAITLKDAYDMACRAHPEVAKALDVEQRRAVEMRQLAEARKKAEDARRASAANVTGQGGIGIADKTKLSLHDELAAHFNRSAAI